MSVKEGASASHWSCEESPPGQRWCVFSWLGDRRTREKLWCLPSGHTAFGPAGSTAALLVCVCVLHEPQNSRGGEGGRGEKWLRLLCSLLRVHFLLLSEKEPITIPHGRGLETLGPGTLSQRILKLWSDLVQLNPSPPQPH